MVKADGEGGGGRIVCGVQGATGRMGRRLLELIADAPDLALGAAIDRPDHPRIGDDAGLIAGLPPSGIPLTATLEPSANVDVMIDFSHPGGTIRLASECAERGVALLVGTTGLEGESLARVRAASDRIALLISPNTSRAVNALMRLVGEAARLLKASADIEIVERHHHFKKDAPSGTALRLGEIAAEAAGLVSTIHGRSGQVGERPRGELGIHAVRAGDNPGEHTVIFGMPGDVIELTHRAYNRDGFATGALEAARFLAGKPPGLYAMADVFG